MTMPEDRQRSHEMLSEKHGQFKCSAPPPQRALAETDAVDFMRMCVESEAMVLYLSCCTTALDSSRLAISASA